MSLNDDRETEFIRRLIAHVRQERALHAAEGRPGPEDLEVESYRFAYTEDMAVKALRELLRKPTDPTRGALR